MGTKYIAFNSKINHLETLCIRVVNNIVPVPSGIEISNTLKYFIYTLNSILKDVTNIYFDLFNLSNSFQRTSLFPNLNYEGLVYAFDKVLFMYPLIHDNQYILAKNILLLFESLMMFVDFALLQELPYKISTLFTMFPYMLYKEIIDLLSFKLLPLLLYGDDTLNLSLLSLPPLLSNIFLYVQEKAFQSQLAETIMAYKKNFYEDLFSVIAYGNENAHYISTRILFNYWPTLNPMPSERKTKFISWERPKCQVINCFGGVKENYGIKLCINPSFSIKYTERPPPCVICLPCYRNLILVKNRSNVFEDIDEAQFLELIFPMEYVALRCENKSCPNNLKNAEYTCYAPECVQHNEGHPIRYCAKCFRAKHKDLPNKQHSNIGINPLNNDPLHQINGEDVSRATNITNHRSHVYQEPVNKLWCSSTFEYSSSSIVNSPNKNLTLVLQGAGTDVPRLFDNLDFVIVEAIVRLLINVKPVNLKGIGRKKNPQLSQQTNRHKTRYRANEADEDYNIGSSNLYSGGGSIKERGINRSFSFDERLLLSRYGVYLLLGLTDNYKSAPMEEMGRLFAALFQWFDSTAYLPEGGLASSVEALKPDRLCQWVKEKTQFNLLPSDLDVISKTSFGLTQYYDELSAKKKAHFTSPLDVSSYNYNVNIGLDQQHPNSTPITNKQQQKFTYQRTSLIDVSGDDGSAGVLNPYQLLFLACLSPHPPDYAKSLYQKFSTRTISGSTTTTVTTSSSSTLQQDVYLTSKVESGLFRLFCLIPYDMVTLSAWQFLIPLWMQTIAFNVSPYSVANNSEFKLLLKKTFDADMSPLQFEPPKLMFKFIMDRLRKPIPTGISHRTNGIFEHYDSLVWLQILTTADIYIPFDVLVIDCLIPCLSQLYESAAAPLMYENPNSSHSKTSIPERYIFLNRDYLNAINQEKLKKPIFTTNYKDWFKWKSGEYALNSVGPTFITNYNMTQIDEPLLICCGIAITALNNQFELQKPTLPYDPDNKRVRNVIKILKHVIDLIFKSLQRLYRNDVTLYPSQIIFHHYWHLINYILLNCQTTLKFICPEYSVSHNRSESSDIDDSLLSNESGRTMGMGVRTTTAAAAILGDHYNITNANMSQSGAEINYIPAATSFFDNNTDDNIKSVKGTSQIFKNIFKKREKLDFKQTALEQYISDLDEDGLKMKMIPDKEAMSDHSNLLSGYILPTVSQEVKILNKDERKSLSAKIASIPEKLSHLTQSVSTASPEKIGIGGFLGKKTSELIASEAPLHIMTATVSMYESPLFEESDTTTTTLTRDLALQKPHMNEIISDQTTVDENGQRLSSLGSDVLETFIPILPTQNAHAETVSPENNQTTQELVPESGEFQIQYLLPSSETAATSSVLLEEFNERPEVIKPMEILTECEIEQMGQHAVPTLAATTEGNDVPSFSSVKKVKEFEEIDPYNDEDLNTRKFWKTSHGEFMIDYPELPERFHLIHSLFKICNLLNREIFPLSRKVFNQKSNGLNNNDRTAANRGTSVHQLSITPRETPDPDPSSATFDGETKKWKLNVDVIDVLLKYRNCALYKCIMIMNDAFLGGQYFSDPRGEHRGFIIWIQENYIIPDTWSLLGTMESHVIQLTLPLFLKCLTISNGRSTFWKMLTINYFNTDWKQRLNTVNSLLSLFHFINTATMAGIDDPRILTGEECPNCISYAFYLLTYAAFDSNMHLSQYVKLMFHSLPFASYKRIFRSWDWQFTSCLDDRKILLEMIRDTLLIFKTRCYQKPTSDYFTYIFYLNAADFLIRHTEVLLIEQYLPTYVKNKITPTHGFRPMRMDRKSQISRFNEVLVAQSTHFNVFSILKTLEIVDKSSTDSQKNTLNDVSTTPEINDQIDLESLNDKYFLIDPHVLYHKDEGIPALRVNPKTEQYDTLYREYSEEQQTSLIYTLANSISAVDDTLSTHLKIIMRNFMHILANFFPADTGKLSKKSNQVVNEIIGYVQILLHYRPKNRIFALAPRALRKFPLVDTFLCFLYQVIDSNIDVGYKLLPLVLDLLLFLPSPQIYASDNVPKYFTLYLLDETQRKLWLQALMVIFFKYEIDENPLYAKADFLAGIVIKTLYEQFFDDLYDYESINTVIDQKLTTTSKSGLKSKTFLLPSSPNFNRSFQGAGNSPGIYDGGVGGKTTLLTGGIPSISSQSSLTRFASFLKPNIAKQTRDQNEPTHTKSLHTGGGGGLSSAISFESLASILKKSPQSKQQNSSDNLDMTTSTSPLFNNQDGGLTIPSNNKVEGRRFTIKTIPVPENKDNNNLPGSLPPQTPDNENLNQQQQQSSGIKEILHGELQEDTIGIALVCLEIFVRRCQILATPHLVDILMLLSRISTYSCYPGEENPCDFDLLNSGGMSTSATYGGGAGYGHHPTQNSIYKPDQPSFSPVHQGLNSYMSSIVSNAPDLPNFPQYIGTASNDHFINRQHKDASFFIPGHCRSIAAQMFRCVLHQYAPNRLFLRLFTTNCDESPLTYGIRHFYTFLSLYRCMIETLKGFPDFTPLHPLSSFLQDFDKEKALSTLSRTKLKIMIANVSDYMECLGPREKFAVFWKTQLLGHFESFFAQITSEVTMAATSQSKLDLKNPALAKTIVNVILALLKIPSISFFKNIFDYFGKILVSCLGNSSVNIEQLWEMCYLCNSNITFTKERDRQYYSRLTVSELVQVLTFKKMILPINVLMIIQLILLDMGTSLGPDIMPLFLQRENLLFPGYANYLNLESVDPQTMINTGVSECIKHFLNEFVIFISDIESLSKFSNQIRTYLGLISLNSIFGLSSPPVVGCGVNGVNSLKADRRGGVNVLNQNQQPVKTNKSSLKGSCEAILYYVPDISEYGNKGLENNVSVNHDEKGDINEESKEVENDDDFSISSIDTADLTEEFSQCSVATSQRRQAWQVGEDNLGSFIKLGLAQILANEMSKETERLYRSKGGIFAASHYPIIPSDTKDGGKTVNPDIDPKILMTQAPVWLRNHFGFLYQRKSLSSVSPQSSLHWHATPFPTETLIKLPLHHRNKPKGSSFQTLKRSNSVTLDATAALSKKGKNNMLASTQNLIGGGINATPNWSISASALMGGAKPSELSSEQQGLKDFNDCISRIRLCCWILLAALHTNCLVKGSSNIPCQPFIIYHHPKISDMLLHLLSKFPEFSQSSVLHTTSIFYGFNLCLLWTVYNEFIISIYPTENRNSFHAENALLSFWCQIIPALLQFITVSKSYPEMICLQFVNVIECLQEINSSSLTKLLPLWRSLIHFQEPLPSHIQMRLNKVLNWLPKLRTSHQTGNYFHSVDFADWLLKLQLKLSRTETQSSLAIQIYTL